MSARVAVLTARSVAEVESLREVWNGFERDVVNADIDYHLLVVGRNPEARPHILIVERDGAPASLVVGRLERIRLSTKLGYKTLQRPLVRALTVSYGGILGTHDEATAAAVVNEILSVLRSGDADVVRLRNLRVGSALHRAGRARPGFFTRGHLGKASPHWRARLNGSYGDYLARRSGKTRANLRRYGRRFEDSHPDAIELRVFRDPAELEQLLEDTGAVYARTYQHGLGVGFSDTGIERDVTAFALKRGWFRGFLLYVNGEPAAFWHGIRYGSIFSTGPTGYDPAFRSERVGTYLLGRMVEELCREGSLEWIDFGFGDAEYKRHFAEESWLEEDVFVYASRPRPVWLNTIRAGTGLADLALRRAAGLKGLPQIKRTWRRRLSRTARKAA